MATIWFILVLFIINAVAAAERPCPEHSTYNKCVSACPKNCTNLYQREVECSSKCEARCVCDEGYVLNSEDKCVKDTDCNPEGIKCDNNLVFKECGILKTCHNLDHLPTNCTRGCFCKTTEEVYCGATNSCHPPSHCGQNEKCQKNDPNSVYVACHPTCVATCKDRNPTCNNRSCVSGCFCKEGYVLDNDKCIATNSCPKN